MQASHVSEDKVLGAIRSFPAGFAAGPDGIRPEHLLELVQSHEAGPRLLTSVTAFANLLLAGNCRSDYQHILFGEKLLALDTKSGGIRPIVVGYVLRRLAAKCASVYANETLVGYFSPGRLASGSQEGVRPRYKQFIAL